ncbi:MAG TPA: hypothetical protein VFM14_05280 [Gemmatimonadales bacterium]|nr:hypothetical protein [Gemmatimonadales bacterium]
MAGGRVVEVTASGDSAALPRARVVLHRIGRELQGPIDSAQTDARGRFRFRFAADTTAIYLVSARRSGIEYFSTPVHLNPARPDTGLRIVVADTSSTAPVTLEARHLVVGPAGSDGSRRIIDIIVLRNAGHRTRAAPDTIRPSWSGSLPSGTAGLDVGEGEFSPSAVSRRGDRVLFFAPIPPGEKQLVTEYVLPAGARTSRLAVDQPTELLNVLLAEAAARVAGPGLTFADTQVIDGRGYRRWSGSVGRGAIVRFSFPASPLALRWLLPTLVALAAGVLVVAGASLGRSATRRTTADPAGTANGLLERMAALDAQYGGRETSTPPEEWQRYRQERDRLKAELSAALAATRR